MGESNKQLKIGALISYAAVAFNILSGLLYTPWMIEKIGSSNYALYTLALSVINVFLLDFGLGSAVSRFLSNYYAKNETEKANGFLGMVYKIYAVISLIVFIILTVFYFNINYIYTKFSSSEIQTFKAIFIAVGFYSVISFPFVSLNGILLANEKFIQIKMCNLIQKMLTVAAIVVTLLFNLGVFALVAVNIIVGLLFILIKLAIVRKIDRVKVDLKYKDNSILKNVFFFSGWVTVSQIALRCIFNIMPTLIGIFCVATEITLFTLASSIEGYIYTIADALNGLFMPKIARIMVAEDKEKRLLELMMRVGKIQLFVIGMITVIFCVAGNDFIHLWLGEEMATVWIMAIFVILPGLIELPQQVAKNAVIITENVKYQALIYTIMACVNIIVSLILIYFYKGIGAALSIFISYNIRTLLLNILYKKKLNIDIKKYFIFVYGKWIIAAVITAATGIVLNLLIKEITILNFVIKCALLCAVYISCVFVFVLNSDERKKFVEKIKRSEKRG